MNIRGFAKAPAGILGLLLLGVAAPALATPPPPTLVPEPGALALIGLGLLGVVVLRRFRAKASAKARSE